MKTYEIIEHPADIGFIAYGKDLRELLQNAAAAMCALACEAQGIEERVEREVRAAGEDHESLLFDWLSDILAIQDGEGLFFRRVVVTELDKGHARGVAHGEKYDKARHRAGTYIKAVTYHQLSVQQAPEGWKATVYLDV
ncbi:MAG TPA: archease [Terriglobia bacterium]|jgi:SHS2 domain-containing protein